MCTSIVSLYIMFLCQYTLWAAAAAAACTRTDSYRVLVSERYTQLQHRPHCAWAWAWVWLTRRNASMHKYCTSALSVCRLSQALPNTRSLRLFQQPRLAHTQCARGLSSTASTLFLVRRPWRRCSTTTSKRIPGPSTATDNEISFDCVSLDHMTDVLRRDNTRSYTFSNALQNNIYSLFSHSHAHTLSRSKNIHSYELT